MVYFTCNACGEQIKKPQVEKHYTQKCRNCSMLTCIDCLKDFHGDEYKTHNACMSEEQRYSKEGRAGWDPSVGQGNKGEKRQNVWTSNLKKILAETDNIDSDVRNIVNTILHHENIPRKKPKFVNFIKNIMGHRAGMHSIDKTWDLFAQALKPAEEPKPAEAAKASNGDSSTINGSEEDGQEKMEESEEEGTKKKSKKEKKKKKNKEAENVQMEEEVEKVEKVKKSKKSKKKNAREEETSEKENEEKPQQSKDDQKESQTANKKRKRDDQNETMEVDDDESSPKKSKFDWDEVITSCLQSKDGNEMKLVKLKKKCVNEYFSMNEGTHKTKEEIGAKFDKKLKKRKYRQLKDKVKLITDDEEAEKESPNPEPVSEPSSAKPPGLSFNKWEATDFGSSAQTDKFRRLMGIKSAPPPKAVASEKRDDGKIFRDLERGFEKARESHFGGKCFNV